MLLSIPWAAASCRASPPSPPCTSPSCSRARSWPTCCAPRGHPRRHVDLPGLTLPGDDLLRLALRGRRPRRLRDRVLLGLPRRGAHRLADPAQPGGRPPAAHERLKDAGACTRVVGLRAPEPANVLTLSRFAFVPVLLVLLLGEDAGPTPAAAAVFGVAALTDAADGHIARSRDMVTPFGRIADPLADKLLVGTALASLVALDRLALWIALVSASARPAWRCCAGTPGARASTSRSARSARPRRARRCPRS